MKDRVSTKGRGAHYPSGVGRGRLKNWTGLVITLFLVAGCQSNPPITMTDNGAAPVYTLGPGDKVRVIVFDHENLSGDFSLDSNGRVALPFVRGVRASGLTLPELEEAIAERLVAQKFLNPQVSVDLIKSRPICIIGEVNKPGCYDYVYGMRAGAVIAMAGGYTYRARRNVVEIIRVDGERGTAAHDTLIYPGDFIEVNERLF